MADNNSVGRISLDLEVTSDLGKQIDQVASKIGKQLESALKNIGNIDIGKSITGSIENSMNAMEKLLEKKFSEAMQKAMANLKRIKIPVDFDIPENIPMPKQRIGTDIPAPRGPPQTSIPSINIPTPKMPKLDMGNMDVLKATIDNVAKSLDIVNAKIEQQQAKLADLKLSYSQAFDGTRKNKLLEQILKTETNINRLIGQSDRLGFTLADLDKQFDKLGSSTKNAGTGVSEVDKKLKSVSNATSKASSGIKNVSNSTKDMHSNMNHANTGMGMFISSMFTWGLIFPMVIGGITSLGKFIGSSLMVNEQFSNSLNQIKSNLWTAFMPIYNAILPALNSLMSALATATAYLASFLSQLFGTTYEASFNAAKTMQDQIGAMNMADKAAKNAANSLTGVSKSAKKANDEMKNSIMSFDEVHQLQLDTPKEEPTPGSGVTTPITPMANMAPIEAATSKWADKFKDILANLWKPFQESWAAEGLNTINAAKHALDGIKAAVESIGRSFMQVWTNGTGTLFLINILKIVQDILNFIGNIGIAFSKAWDTAGLGTSVIQSIFDAINSILSLIHQIGLSINEVASNGTAQTTFTILLTIFRNIFQTIAEIGTALSNAWTGGNAGTQIIQNIWNAFNNLLLIVSGVSESIKRVFAQEGPKFANIFMQALLAGSKVIENVTQQLGWIWDHGGQHAFEGLVKLGLKIGELALFIFTNFVAPFVNWFTNMVAPAISPVLDAVGKLFDVLSNVIDWLMSDGKPVLDVVITALGSFALAWGIVTAAIKTYVITQNLMQIATTGLKTAIGFCTSTVGIWVIGIAAAIAIGILLYKNWDTIKAKASQIWNGIKSVFEGFKNWLGSVFTTDWSQKFGIMGNILNGYLANIRNAFGGVKQIFGGLIDFIAGIFTGNWSRAWQGVVNIFKGIFNTLSAVAKAPLNGIISLVNMAIDALNKFHVKVPEGVPIIGGRDIGFNIPKIPYLAKGGIVDQPTTAVIGEAGKEAVVPLENNTGGLSLLANMLAQRIPTLQQPQLVMAGSGGSDERQTDRSYFDELKALLQEIIDLMRGNGNDDGSGGSNDFPVLQLGTLIGDDRSLRELERKLRAIRDSEDKRRG